ncbi:MAG: ACT domain-containing protein [Candidatus Micrarchaeota archaeon]
MVSCEDAIAKLNPKIVPGTYWICNTGKRGLTENAIGFFKERKGYTLVLKQEKKPALRCAGPKAMVDVGVETPSGAEGFMARVTGALGKKNICCYVFSAYWQDFVFVPKKDANRAIKTLRNLKKH